MSLKVKEMEMAGVFDGTGSVEERIVKYKEYVRANKERGEQITEQGHAHEVDINAIFKKFDKRGLARLKQQVEVDETKLADLTGMDYQKSMQDIARVNSEFEELPSQVRARYGNDPGEYLKDILKPSKASDEIMDHVPKSKIKEDHKKLKEKEEEVVE